MYWISTWEGYGSFVILLLIYFPLSFHALSGKISSWTLLLQGQWLKTLNIQIDESCTWSQIAKTYFMILVTYTCAFKLCVCFLIMLVNCTCAYQVCHVLVTNKMYSPNSSLTVWQSALRFYASLSGRFNVLWEKLQQLSLHSVLKIYFATEMTFYIDWNCKVLEEYFINRLKKVGTRINIYHNTQQKKIMLA